jgi:hypothetical protein
LTPRAFAYSNSPEVNPATLDKLRSLPHQRFTSIWPEGTRQCLTKELATYFFSLVSTCDTSLVQLLRDHPELPPFAQIDSWRANNKSGFADGWKRARQAQAHFVADQCFDLAKNACPKTAHVVRVKFDVYKWLAAKLNPIAYGDKPLPTQQTTTVNVGVSISPERLHDLRSKLDQTRSALVPKSKRNGSTDASTLIKVSRTPRLSNGDSAKVNGSAKPDQEHASDTP